MTGLADRSDRDILIEIHTDMKNVKKTIDNQQRTFERQIKTCGHRFGEVEERISPLQTWKDKSTGMFIGVGTVAGVAATIITLAVTFLTK